MLNKTSVEVVVPIYNEEAELEENITKLHSFIKRQLRSYQWHITIADNASTDNSLKIAENLTKKLTRVNFDHLSQKGRGRAIKKVWTQSKSDINVYMDIDLSTDLNSLPLLIDSLTNGYDIAIGSRLLNSSKVLKRPLKREILSRVYNILIKILFGTHFSDAQCGFKAVSKPIVHFLLPHIEDKAWFFDSELLIVAEKLGFKIKEIPVVWVDNPGSTVRVLKTVYGDLQGLWRLFMTKPWTKIRRS